MLCKFWSSRVVPNSLCMEPALSWDLTTVDVMLLTPFLPGFLCLAPSVFVWWQNGHLAMSHLAAARLHRPTWHWWQGCHLLRGSRTKMLRSPLWQGHLRWTPHLGQCPKSPFLHVPGGPSSLLRGEGTCWGVHSRLGERGLCCGGPCSPWEGEGEGMGPWGGSLAGLFVPEKMAGGVMKRAPPCPSQPVREERPPAIGCSPPGGGSRATGNQWEAWGTSHLSRGAVKWRLCCSPQLPSRLWRSVCSSSKSLCSHLCLAPSFTPVFQKSVPLLHPFLPCMSTRPF